MEKGLKECRKEWERDLMSEERSGERTKGMQKGLEKGLKKCRKEWRKDLRSAERSGERT